MISHSSWDDNLPLTLARASLSKIDTLWRPPRTRIGDQLWLKSVSSSLLESDPSSVALAETFPESTPAPKIPAPLFSIGLRVDRVFFIGIPSCGGLALNCHLQLLFKNTNFFASEANQMI